MRSKTGIFLMIIGAMLVAAALSLAVYNYREDKVAGEAAESVMTELEKAIAENAGQQETSDDSIMTVPGQKLQNEADATEHVIANKDSLVSVSGSEGSVSESGSESYEPLYVDGHYYVGVISIPELGIRLPVIDSYEGDNLRYAPCLYSGYVDSRMIICAHNYNSHFGRIKELSGGSLVIFTDVYGNDHRYTVMDIEIVSGDDSNRMEAGDWDLSLFTCTFDGSDRVTVRCCHEKTED